MTRRDDFLPVPPDAERVATLRPFSRGLQDGPRPNGADHSADQPPGKPRFPIIGVDDITLGTEPVWLIKRILPATGLTAVFGLPKSGKSFVLADALFHVAMGRRWAGCDVQPGAIVYVSSEGVSGLKRRLVAMRRHYGVEGKAVPFGFSPAMPALGHANSDADTLIENIREWLASIGTPPLRAIALDTLARVICGGDENMARDMGQLVGNAERIAAAFGCLVILVHHAGKTVERGSRGSNALDGACDCMWSVEKGEAQSRVTIHAMK